MCLLEIFQPYLDLHHSCMLQNYVQYISYNNCHSITVTGKSRTTHFKPVGQFSGLDDSSATGGVSSCNGGVALPSLSLLKLNIEINCKSSLTQISLALGCMLV